MNRIATPIILAVSVVVGGLLVNAQQTEQNKTSPVLPGQNSSQVKNSVLGNESVQTDTAVQNPNSEVPQKQGQKAYAELSSKDYVQAVNAYQVELEQARQRGDHQLEAAIALKRARALDTLSAADQSFTSEAAVAYRQAITAAEAAGDPARRSLAANNLAVLLLKQGNAAEAGEATRAIDLSAVPAAQRSVFQFNIGRTLEVNGKGGEAYEQYSQALVSNPNLTQAWEGAFRTISTQQPLSFSELARLTDQAIASGHAEIANEQLLKLLTAQDDEQLKKSMATVNYTPQQVLTPLLHSYAAEEVTPPLFRSREIPRLRKIAEVHRAFKTSVREIETVFLGTLPPGFSEAAASFRDWEYGQDGSLATVLRGVAGFYEAQGQPDMAIGRYGAGWQIAHEPSCAVHYASLVSRNPTLDPDGSLINRLVEDVFMEKARLYMIEDWTHILPLHIALGTIFEEQKKWGETGDPRGALFQWQHAIAADAEVRKKNPSFPPSPGLHAHLGNIYRAIGKKDDAIKEFLTAGLGFLDAGDRDEARRNATIIKEISPTGEWGQSAEERSGWERLMRETGSA